MPAVTHCTAFPASARLGSAGFGAQQLSSLGSVCCALVYLWVNLTLSGKMFLMEPEVEQAVSALLGCLLKFLLQEQSVRLGEKCWNLQPILNLY